VKANVAASIRAQLRNLARTESRPFQEVLQFYGLERFLVRLARSRFRDRFVLKGALLLRVWDAPLSRPTRDIDFLGRTENSIANLEAIAREICAEAIDDDGIEFDPGSIVGERIKEDADYEGVRIKFLGLLEKARVPMQLDIAFGDVVHPSVVEAPYPSLLGQKFGGQPSKSEATLLVYPRESVVAEKFQAMVFLGSINSRMKDFYDIWLLSRCFDFDGRSLAKAIAATFDNRGTEIDVDPVALRSEFFDSPQTVRQWSAFRERGLGEEAPESLRLVADQIRAFLLPPAESLAAGRQFSLRWSAPGPWE
jgi:hypothetical protein